MLYGPTISINYETHRKELRKIAQELIAEGYSEVDVYRAIGLTLGLLGKIRSTESKLRTYTDRYGMKYYIAESFRNKTVYYMVRTNDKSFCNCEKYLNSVIAHCKNPEKYPKISCKHILASKILSRLVGV